MFLFGPQALAEEARSEVLVTVASDQTIIVEGKTYVPREIERALKELHGSSPFHVVVAIEDPDAAYEHVTALYSALLDLHEKGLVASVAQRSLNEEGATLPRGRFSDEVPTDSICVRLGADSSLSVGQIFEPGAPVPSLLELRELARRTLEAEPRKPFVLEAETGSAAGFVEEVRRSLVQEGVQVIYLLGSKAPGVAPAVCLAGANSK